MPRLNRVSIAKLLIRLLALLPLPVLHGIGHLAGSWMALRPSKYRRNTRLNLQWCYPQLTEAERARLLRRTLQESAKGLLEVAAFWHWSPQRLDRLVKEVRNQHLLMDNYAHGGGVIVAVPHLGAWEMLQVYFAQRIPLNSLYLPPKRAEFEPLIREARERLGGRAHPATPSGLRALYKALAKGEVTAILPDQEAKEGVFAPFFGIQAKTMTLLPKLAARSKAPVIYAYAVRLPWGRGYSVRFAPAPAEVADPDPIVAATAMNAGLEACVHEAPEQYQWPYQRFRRRPDGSENPYRQAPL